MELEAIQARFQQYLITGSFLFFFSKKYIETINAMRKSGCNCHFFKSKTLNNAQPIGNAIEARSKLKLNLFFIF